MQNWLPCKTFPPDDPDLSIAMAGSWSIAPGRDGTVSSSCMLSFYVKAKSTSLCIFTCVALSYFEESEFFLLLQLKMRDITSWHYASTFLAIQMPHWCTVYIIWMHFMWFLYMTALPSICSPFLLQLMFMVSSLLTPYVALLECSARDLESVWTRDESLSVFPR